MKVVTNADGLSAILRRLMLDSSLIEGQKRTLRIGGKVTSVRLEPQFWDVLEQIAAEKRISVQDILKSVRLFCDKEGADNFTSRLRVICIRYLAGRVGITDL